MSAQALQEDQLIELLLQLKKTTPDQAKSILNAQPQIAYALMSVMVNLNAVNVEVIQKTLSSYSSLQNSQVVAPAVQVPPPTAPHSHSSSVPQASAIPPRMQAQPPPRGSTPNSYPPQAPAYMSQPYPGSSTAGPAYGTASQPPGLDTLPPSGKPPLPDALAAIPEDQKALIMRVIAMTPEEIHRLPPQDRNNIIQLRATLGIPT